MLVTIPSTITVFNVNISINPNDVKRLKQLDDIEVNLNDWDESEWFIIKEYEIQNYYIRLKMEYNSSYIWIGLELLDYEGNFSSDTTLKFEQILNGQNQNIFLEDDRNPKERIIFDISYVLDESVESCLDSNAVFIRVEEKLKSHLYTCPHCQKDLRAVNVVRRGEFHYIYDEKNERFEYDSNGLADTPFICGYCYNTLETFKID